MSRIDIISLILLVVQLGSAAAQHGGRVLVLDDTTDVVDHAAFDSLWRASIKQGRLWTGGAQSSVMQRYLRALAMAQPDAYYPAARRAFWTNAYMAGVLLVMDRHAGVRSTIVDTALMLRDTVTVAGERHTLQSLAAMVVAAHGTVLSAVLLGNGSSHAPPLLRTATTARTIDKVLREQSKRVFRSERFVLFDPGSDALQIAGFFEPYLEGMTQQAGSVVAFLLPWLDEVVAAECALRKTTLRVVVSDRIEQWRRRR